MGVAFVFSVSFTIRCGLFQYLVIGANHTVIILIIDIIIFAEETLFCHRSFVGVTAILLSSKPAYISMEFCIRHLLQLLQLLGKPLYLSIHPIKHDTVMNIPADTSAFKMKLFLSQATWAV